MNALQNLEDIYVLAPAQSDLFRGVADPSTLCRHTTLLEAELYFRDGPAPGAWLDRWNAAWEQVVARHAVLRTLFVWEDFDAPQQVVQRRADRPWRLCDLRALSAEEQEREVVTLTETARAQSLDPSRAPLANGTLLATSEHEARLLWLYHPLILDRECAALAIAELLVAQTCLVQDVEPRWQPACSFRNHVAWAARRDLSVSRSFWKERCGANEVAPFSQKGSWPAGATPNLARQRVDLPPALGREMTAFAHANGASVAGIVVAAWTLLLQRRGAAPPLVGVDVSTRRDSADPSQVMLGPFERTLPLRLEVPPEASAADLVRHLEEQRDALRRHADLPLDEILAAEGMTSRVAAPPPPLQGTIEVDVRRVRWSQTESRMPVTVELPAAQPAHLDVVFDRSRMEPELAAGLGAELRALLIALASGRRTAVSLLEPSPSTIVAGAGVDFHTIEALLRQHRAVRASRVRSELDAGGNESVVAYVQPAQPQKRKRPVQFSLFYFADADSGDGRDKYRLYLDSARYADRNGFAAVWTPERHFHENGGLYPSPSVLSAALATTTDRIGLRAGSVVLPLHHTLRVAEEWAIVDNLSRGRVGLSFASGWVPNDFAFFPERYADKREHMFRQIEELQRLWRGERIAARDGVGNDYEVGVFPRPWQRELPIWITCSGDPAVFERTAALRANVLTAMITMSLDEAAQAIEVYRRKLREMGDDRGHVTMMIHTFVGDQEAATRELVRPALSKFLGSHVGLVRSVKKSSQSAIVNDEEELVSFAFEKYYRAASLIGTQEKCAAMVERLRDAGVDEVACLVDFGLATDVVLDGLRRLKELKENFDRDAGDFDEQGNVTVAGLRRYLAARLPDAAVPQLIKIANVLPDAEPIAAAAADP